MIMTQIFEEWEEHTHPECMSSALAMVQYICKVPGNKFFISLACFASFENIDVLDALCTFILSVTNQWDFKQVEC